ncbi:MAG: hypothetical protein KKG00_17780 [Bacteroidetes bacterium]|nr:hypothetical protein [Bacteroidota bacterium]
MKKIPYYGRSLVHLLGVLFCYALVTYAAIKLFGNVSLWVALAFPAGIAVHDFILFPLYRKADQVVVDYQMKQQKQEKKYVLWLNHLRIPVVISFILLLCYFPLILRLSSNRELYTGLAPDSYLYRWLLVTAALFAGSAVAYFIRKR